MFKKAASLVLATCLCSMAVSAWADGIDDPTRKDYFGTFVGKKIAYLPVAMGFDLTEGWAAVIRKRAEQLGMTFEVRDPNWSTDAGAQALTALIAEKPDVIVVHNPDVQSYARLLKRAEDAGIKVVQINMKSSYPTDAYVGADWIGIGEAQAQAIVDHCGQGTSGKVQIVQGVLTAAASAYTMKGVENVLSQHPEIKVVSNQAADWDATKARNLTATVLQQNPDLCGSIGFWDVMDTGTAAAIKESGKPVHIVTSGGGAQMACDNVKAGLFGEVISYDVPAQGRDINNMIEALIQSKEPAGTTKVSLYSPITRITKDSVREGMCWDLDQLKK
jgi:ABC-type sugar transport system substrate-binding protein